jgi:hypothetical protein
LQRSPRAKKASFIPRETPMMVPPVPAPETKTETVEEGRWDVKRECAISGLGYKHGSTGEQNRRTG